MNEQRWPPAAYAAAGLLFVLLATANAAGYRYGVSDQAFSVPAIVHALNPATFPRDAAFIESQGRLMLFDEGVAGVVRITGLSLETTFVLGYLLTAGLTWTAAVLIGQRVLRAPWAIVAFGAFLTLRHRIPRTSVNSLEPYFYPRTLAFALGLLAMAAIFRQRRALALVLVAAALAVHITTGGWFAVLIGTACVCLEARLRRWMPLVAAGVAVIAIGASVTGRLQPYLVPLDATWLDGMGIRDSLFPTDWPLWAWTANLALPLALIAIHRGRLARQTATRTDTALVYGALALVAIFVATLPLVAARWALPTQLQISRVFWLVEFVTLLYAVALVAEWPHDNRARLRTLRVLAGVALALSVARGTFVMGWEHPERRLFEVHLRPSPWTNAMAWLSRQPIDVSVLAHPAHATLYGSSVRVAAQRDVVLEEVKDSSVALYSRDVAVRVATRRGDIGPAFDDLSTAVARQLAERYDVDYLVTAGAPLAFPVAYSNATFRIYDVRSKPR